MASSSASMQLPRCLLLLALLILIIHGSTQAAAAPGSPAAVAVSLSPSAQPPLSNKPARLTAAFQRLPARTPIPTSAFKVSHEQLLHMVGVGQDLDTFFHVHPSSTTPSAFTFSNLVFPKAGTYLIALDGQLADGVVATQTKLAVGGTPRMTSSTSVTTEAGPAATTVTVKSTPLKAQQPAVSLSSLVVKNTAANNAGSSSSGVYTAAVSGPQGAACKPGTPSTYVWTLSHGSSKAVTDLRLYYGAPMHLAVVKSDLSFIAHEHGDVVGAPKSTGSNNKVGMTNASPAAAAATGGDEHGGHAGHGRRRLLQHEGHDMADMAAVAGGAGAAGVAGGAGSSTKQTGFGPSIKATVTFPSAGRYLLVGQLARGSELILLPLFVSCSG